MHLFIYTGIIIEFFFILSICNKRVHNYIIFEIETGEDVYCLHYYLLIISGAKVFDKNKKKNPFRALSRYKLSLYDTQRMALDNYYHTSP